MPAVEGSAVSPSKRRAGGVSSRSTRQRLERLRSSSDTERHDRLFLASLRLRIPRNVWTSPFSLAHPEVRIEALNRTEVSKDLSVSDYWISGQPPGVWAREIQSYSDVTRVDSLAEVGDGCLYRITYRNPPVVYLYQRLGLPIQFPLRIQGGSLTWEVVARFSEFQAIMEHVRTADPNVKVLSVRRRPLRSHLPLLSETQHRLLSQAMSAGYFAVPRGITLTELARRLNRSKSSISESIALIEKKLLESALRPPTLAV
jgi:predicted DNA binding protein